MPESIMRGRLYRDECWGFQDERFIFKDASRESGEAWVYGGRHNVELGDYIKIIDRSGKVVFDRKILYESSSPAGHFWFPAGVSREDWIKFFSDDGGYSAELTRSAPSRLWGIIRDFMHHMLIEIVDYKEFHGALTLDSGTGYLVNILWNFPSGRKPIPVLLSFTPREYWCNKKNHDRGYCICRRLKSHLLSLITLPEFYLNSDKFVCPPKTPRRLREAIDRYFLPRPAIEVFEKNSLGGLFSFEGIVTYQSAVNNNVRIHFYMQDGSDICGCKLKKDKIGRWRRSIKKEERICICKDLPRDIITGTRFLVV